MSHSLLLFLFLFFCTLSSPFLLFVPFQYATTTTSVWTQSSCTGVSLDSIAPAFHCVEGVVLLACDRVVRSFRKRDLIWRLVWAGRGRGREEAENSREKDGRERARYRTTWPEVPARARDEALRCPLPCSWGNPGLVWGNCEDWIGGEWKERKGKENKQKENKKIQERIEAGGRVFTLVAVRLFVGRFYARLRIK